LTHASNSSLRIECGVCSEIVYRFRWHAAGVPEPPLQVDAHALYARERLPEGRDGYEFSVLGDFEADVWDLFKLLYERIRRGLAIRHVERGELGWRITDPRRLVGRIVWDQERGGEVPLLVIDGRPFTWDQVGRMLTAFEGFTLRAFGDDTIEVVGAASRRGELVVVRRIAIGEHSLPGSVLGQA
jgi:hypothetical protein